MRIQRQALPHPSMAAAYILCAALVVAPCTGAHAQTVIVRHSPPPRVEAWQPVVLEATLAGDVSPELIAAADAIVATTDGALITIPLTLSRQSLFGEIPGALVAPPRLSYYLRIVTVDGGVVTAPPGAREDRFFTVPVSGGSETGADPVEAELPLWPGASVEILSPLAGEVVVERRPQIAALFDPPLSEPWEALVLLDGADVTETSSVSSELFVHSPQGTLARGAHRITFSAATETGTREASWVFFVLERSGSAGEELVRGRAQERESIATRDVWQIAGRLEAGWAAVVAETTAVESVDVFLPYEEVSQPSADFYLSGVKGTGSFLITARHDPVYSNDLEWLVSGRTEKLEIEAGQVFPSLSKLTLNWAAGQGGRIAARAGRSTTEVLAMRMTEADTLAGFGIYSRFALGGKQSFDWSEGLSTAVVYLSVFDREGSVLEEQRLSDPLRNHVAAGLARARRGALTGELEVALSESSGETEGRGTAVRAGLKLERDWHNKVSLAYVASEPGFYSAGSFEYDPGEHALELDYAYRPNTRLSTSGWVRTGRSFDSGSSLAQDGLELKVYSRTEFAIPADIGSARTYAVVRYDHVPYETYDYRYAYAALGGSWRRGGTRLSGSVSWSRAHTPDESNTWSANGDLRRELIPGRWTARAAARWSEGTKDPGTDYTRVQYIADTIWDFGGTDLTVEYWLIDREDRADPLQSYTEHVLRVGVGRDL